MPVIRWERKLVKWGAKAHCVPLPEELLEALGWKHGDSIIISSTDHEVRLKKK